MKQDPIWATGRRKTSIAQVRLIPEGAGKVTVNGKSVDLSKGRLLLVTHADSDFTWQQESAELPKSVTAPRTVKEAEALAKENVKKLQQGNDAVREFLK